MLNTELVALAQTINTYSQAVQHLSSALYDAGKLTQGDKVRVANEITQSLEIIVKNIDSLKPLVAGVVA